MDRIAVLQDLQDRLFWLSWGLTMDRIAGFTGKVVFKLSWKLKKDRMAGFRDLQDRGLWLSWGLKMDRIAGFRRLW